MAMSTAALIVAIVSLVLAAGSLAWQAASFALSGARVKVALRHGAVGPGGALTSQPGKFDVRRAAEEGFTLEVLAIEIINVGRMGVSVTRIGTRFSNGMGFFETTNRLNPGLPFRLDPQTNQTFYVSMEPVRAAVYSAQEVLGAGVVRVRGTVELGNGKTVQTGESLQIPPA
jgi:hypothetical protein